uniref:Cadherin domain-containing protein n=1 Tax=Meleagris gallopavo TaxID=9103 RepID=G1MRD4_MELGA
NEEENYGALFSIFEAYLENVPIGTLVYTFNAKDGDGSSPNSKIQYSLEMSSMAENPFVVHPLYGALVTASPLDREIIRSVILTVSATDQAINVADRRRDSLTAKIVILDVNDNSPSFISSPLCYVMEDADVGTAILDLFASDRDDGPNGKVTYSLIGDTFGAFAINSVTGSIVTTKELDREIKSQYTLRAVASDCSPHLPRSSTASIVVHIDDVNDNNPVFLQSPIRAFVPAETTVNETVATVRAEDVDLGPNGAVVFSLLAAETLFEIDPETGDIVLQEPLASEDFSTELLVMASDQGTSPRTAVTLVIIFTKEQEEEILFSRSLYEASVPENSYSIIDGNAENLFTVETSVTESETSYKLVGNLVLSSVLDKETIASHRLVLLASDHGKPSLNSTATVLITVLDVNDNPPEFSSSEYHVHIKESLPVGSHVIEVLANDPDEGSNAEITYAIISGNDKQYFRMDGKTGSVDLMKTLDYEDTTKFTLLIQGTDGGADVKNVAFSVVHISVLDDNDYAPVFLFPSMNCIVSENLPSFSFVCTVTALDFDKGSYGHLTYSIQSSCLAQREAPGDHHMFFIDPLTGDIHTKQTFDYESQNKYCLIIQAKDKGDLLATITVQVDIEGRDEFDPVFSQDQYFFNLPTKNEAGQLLGKVTASDNDGGPDGVVHYSLLKTSAFFSVNQSSGGIYLTQTVHRNRSDRKRNDDTLKFLPKEKPFVLPPPLVCYQGSKSVAQPGLKPVPPRMPNVVSGQVFKKCPCSPLIQSHGYPPPTGALCFSPSLCLSCRHLPLLC